MITDLKDETAKLKLNPVFVMIDFESAIIDAYKTHFQGIEIKLYHFHFGQNIGEKWKEQYTSDENSNSYIKQMTALALIPPNEVADAFDELSLHATENYYLDYF